MDMCGFDDLRTFAPATTVRHRRQSERDESPFGIAALHDYGLFTTPNSNWTSTDNPKRYQGASKMLTPAAQR